MSLITRAPWLPPKTRSLSLPPCSAAGNGVRAATSTAGRTGLPVWTTGAGVAGMPLTSGKPVAMAATRPARKRFARPMTPFCSWITVGMRSIAAAITGGTVG